MPLETPRQLPGIDVNRDELLALLHCFAWGEELRALPLQGAEGSFYYRNNTFGVGDAEVLYSMIRLKRPKRVIEVGGGNSTLVIAEALSPNQAEDASYACRHLCIEPYENPYLEKTGAEVMRTRLEDVNPQVFSELAANDILFIDSSHVIRPQGDVLTIYLKILLRLAPGVLIHIHDIFTPRDYPARWLDGQMLLWNEQYLLEALLTGNPGFRVISALNMLYYTERAALEAACPMLAAEGGPEPGSFWLVRNGQ